MTNTYQIQLNRLNQIDSMTVIVTKKSKQLVKTLIADLIEQLGFDSAAQSIRDNDKAKENAEFAVNIWSKGAKLYNLQGEEITPEGRVEFYNKYSHMLLKIIDKVL